MSTANSAKQANGRPRQLAVQYGRKRIEYRLQYSDRRTLSIDVHPDLSVVATAPHGAEDDAVEQRMRKRAPWIVRQQRFFQIYLPTQPPRRYISGESHRYLGRQYRLRVHQGPQDAVRMSRGQIMVTVDGEPAEGRVRALVTKWFHGRAELIFGELFEQVAAEALRHGIKADAFEIRRMRNRWGSCTSAGRIMLNPELIAAPKPCIEYVITHELCHLKELNHGPAFYRLLKKLMPDWEERRERLNGILAK